VSEEKIATLDNNGAAFGTTIANGSENPAREDEESSGAAINELDSECKTLSDERASCKWNATKTNGWDDKNLRHVEVIQEGDCC